MKVELLPNLKRLFIYAVFMLGIAPAVFAQAPYTIGTGTSTNASWDYPTPFGDYYEGMRAQYLFRASELQAAGMSAGNISGIRWQVTALNGSGVHEQYAISIGTTSANSLANNTWEPNITTPVFGPANYQPVSGNNTFTLPTPFFWDGSSNIVVEVCFGAPGNTSGIWYTSNASVPYTVLSFNGSHTYRADNGGNLCGTGSTSNTGSQTYRPNTTFIWQVAPPCVGPVTAGTASGPASVCPNQSFTVSLTGNTTGFGTTYQWQSSPAGQNNWTNIPGATFGSYTGTQSVATDYRAIVTCASATPPGNTATSNVVTINMNSFLSCYCVPTTTWGCTWDYISNVTLATINNNTTCSGTGYTTYTTPNPDLLTGYSYPISVTTAGSSEGIAVWIDWNQNGVFEQSEAVIYNQYIGTTPATYTANVAVPTNAVLGTTKMRVRCQWAGGVTDPCINYSYGETEDYYVNIKYAPPAPAVTINNSTDNPYTACSGKNIVLTATSTVPNAQFLWSGPNFSATGSVVALNNIQTSSAGTYTVRIVDGPDTSGATTRTIVVNQTPGNPVGFSDTVCYGNPAMVHVLPDTNGFQHRWYDAPVGGNVVFTGDTIQFPSLTSDSVFYVVTGGGGTANSLATTTAGGNSCGGGVMFNVTPTKNVSIDSFKALMTSAGPVNVYYKAGSYAGFETNAGAWTLLGSSTMTGGANTQAMINVGTSLQVPANTTYAIYLNYASGYTTGAGTYTNADMTINTGIGLCGQFSSTNNPRSFNGVVYYHSGTGCESDRVPVAAVVGAPPSVQLGEDTAFCEGRPLILDAGNPGGKYTWSTGDSSQTIKVVNVSGQYWVTVDKYCEASDTINVSIDPLPYTNGISYVRSGNTYFYEPAEVKYVDSYLWLFGDGTSDTSRVVTHTYPDGSPYTVRLIVFNHCGADTTTIIIPVGVSDINATDDGIAIYPNPATERVTVKATANMAIDDLMVINNLGAVVYREKLDAKTSEHTVNVSMLPSGYYFIRLNTEQGVVNKPFQIVK